MKNYNKEPLYRKVNTKARGCHHRLGTDAKYDRNTKEGIQRSMKSGVRRGLDYTPLFKFLLSKVGKKWDEVYQEAQSRLDSEEPIFWMVDLDREDSRKWPSNIPEETKKRFNGSFPYHNSYYSLLIVDEEGVLQIKDPSLKNQDIVPHCPCCTHTFNGKPLVNKFNAKRYEI
jgi:hypothetical protein